MMGWLPRGLPSRIAFAVGAAALLLGAYLGRFTPRSALSSYLFAFLFFTGLSVGSVSLALVPVLTGGGWAIGLRPPLLAAMRVLPLQALLSLPLLFGSRLIYPWADAHALTEDAQLRAQSWYLNSGFFTWRTLGYFVIWLLVAAAFKRNLARPAHLPRIAAAGLIAYVLTCTGAAVDWVMSLQPHWHSTVFGLLVATGWMLAAAAWATLCACGREGGEGAPPPLELHDLGNLLLALVLAWSYLAFMQYLTVWIADLPAETSWYIPRTLTSWRLLAWFLIAFHFSLPLAVLLSRRAKQRRAWLQASAAMLLLASLADSLWLVIPASRAAGLTLRFSDALSVMGVGGLWLCFFWHAENAGRASA